MTTKLTYMKKFNGEKWQVLKYGEGVITEFESKKEAEEFISNL